MTEQIWIRHTKSGEPKEFEAGERVCYRLRDGTEGVQQAEWLDWSIEGHPGDVVEWFPVAGIVSATHRQPSVMELHDQMAHAGPTGVEKQLCDLIAKRQQLGIRKYGTTLADNPAALVERLQHMLEELLDGAAYAMWAINQIKQHGDDLK